MTNMHEIAPFSDSMRLYIVYLFSNFYMYGKDHRYVNSQRQDYLNSTDFQIGSVENKLLNDYLILYCTCMPVTAVKFVINRYTCTCMCMSVHVCICLKSQVSSPY